MQYNDQMAIKRNKRFQAEVATSSLSDIMFFLLLFFLIISTLANPNVIKMMLPKASNNEKTNRQHISISVTEDKRYFIDKKEVPFDQLESTLLAEIGENTDQAVVVRIPFDSQIQELVDLLQIGVKNNLKFVIATQTK
jgi:biopolymer transport protein ExbD